MALDSNGTRVPADWKTLAVWALITLLSVVTYFSNKQWDSIEKRMGAVEISLQNVLKDNDKRLSILEEKHKDAALKPCNQ